MFLPQGQQARQHINNISLFKEWVAQQTNLMMLPYRTYFAQFLKNGMLYHPAFVEAGSHVFKIYGCSEVEV